MNDILNMISSGKPVFYRNELALKDPGEFLGTLDIGIDDIYDAGERMKRFAPLIATLFPETNGGIIESPLARADRLRNVMYPGMKDGLYLKLDSHLQVAGSIKARGGIYEVLKTAEEILEGNSVLTRHDDYRKILDTDAKGILSKHVISVASTGNLGLSIGIMGTALGFRARVHMSSDAKEWKKARLRARGVEVIEHEGDFTYAARMGRTEAENDSMIHFVDDERSRNLFLGYAVSAIRIKDDLEANGIVPTVEKPLILYLPCGVGGAPGGITFGFKHVFNDAVKAYFAEPVSSPCMLLGVLTGKYGSVNVRDYGLDNTTDLDGLAVASPSDFVAPLAAHLCDGFYTVRDEEMFMSLYLTGREEGIRIEPSAAAGLPGPVATGNLGRDAWHIAWTTGGLFVPDDIYDKMYSRGMKLYEDSRL